MNPRNPKKADDAKCMSRSLKAVANETRLGILYALETGDRQLNDLVDATGRPYPSVLQHLKPLIDEGWVTKVDGRYPAYHLADGAGVSRSMVFCHSL